MLSDTHGRLYDDVAAALTGADRIIHAGDVGQGVLEGLQAIAPVIAVRGNTDGPDLGLPSERLVDLEGHRLLVAHVRAATLALHHPLLEGLAAVVFGHSHKAELEWEDGILYLNPGAAGPSRFGLPRSVAIIEVGPAVTAMIVPLADKPPAAHAWG